MYLPDGSTVLEDMYEQWKENPEEVDRSWDSFFRAVDSGVEPGEAITAPPKRFSKVRACGEL